MNTLENQSLPADRAKTREGIESAEPDTLRLHKILVPLNLSECSRPTLQYAARVARQFGATITLLHAGLPPKLAAAKIASGLIEISRQELGPDFGADAITRQGEPVEEIVAAASELNINLIIIPRMVTAVSSMRCAAASPSACSKRRRVPSARSEKTCSCAERGRPSGGAMEEHRYSVGFFGMLAARVAIRRCPRAAGRWKAHTFPRRRTH